MILELTKGEIFELMVSALGGFLLLCKWMKSTNMRKVREYLEKQPLDGLSDCSCLGDFMKRSSCKKLFNYYFLGNYIQSYSITLVKECEGMFNC